MTSAHNRSSTASRGVNDGSPPKFVDPSLDKDNTAIGLQSGRYQPGRKRAIVSDAEGAQPIVKLQLSEMFPASFIALCIACPCTCRKPELTCQEGKKFCGRGLIRQERASRIPEECQLYGKTQAILSSSTTPDEAEILITQDVMFDQTGTVQRDRFKSVTLRG
jgi:hypothetical protein